MSGDLFGRCDRCGGEIATVHLCPRDASDPDPVAALLVNLATAFATERAARVAAERRVRDADEECAARQADDRRAMLAERAAREAAEADRDEAREKAEAVGAINAALQSGGGVDALLAERAARVSAEARLLAAEQAGAVPRLCAHGNVLPGASSGWCWCARAERAEERLAEVEAQAGAMRAALIDIRGRHDGMQHHEDCPAGAHECVWVLVEPETPYRRRHLRLAGTGHSLSATETDTYVGTFQIKGGRLVFHLFDCGWARG